MFAFYAVGPLFFFRTSPSKPMTLYIRTKLTSPCRKYCSTVLIGVLLLLIKQTTAQIDQISNGLKQNSNYIWLHLWMGWLWIQYLLKFVMSFSSCFHHVHMGCLALQLALATICLPFRVMATQQCVCPHPECGAHIRDHMLVFASLATAADQLELSRTISPVASVLRPAQPPTASGIILTEQDDPCCICLQDLFDHNQECA